MAAGDYVIRRNVSNVDTYPTTVSGDLLLLWDTAVANVGSGITGGADGIFVLGETGRFLVMYSDYAATTDQANNERINVKLTLTLAGVELVEGYCTSFIRKNNTGSDELLGFGAGIIEVTTTTGNGDELEVRAERIDDSTTGSPARAGNNRAGITILKLDDTWDYARYRSSAVRATSTTDHARTVMNIQTTVEEDATFTRTVDTVDIATGNLVLAVYSAKSEDPLAAGRSEYQGNLFLNAAVVPGSWTHQYIRETDNTIWGGSSNVCLLNPTSGWDLDIGIVTRDAGNEEYEVALQLVELPAGAEACILEATTGDINTAATNFLWDTNPYIDDPPFAHTLGQSNIDVDNAGDYLVMMSHGENEDGGVQITRAVPAVQFRVNTTDIEHVGDSSYLRASGTADHATLSCATILPGLSASDSIHCHNDRLGTITTAVVNSSGAFSVLRLEGLFGDTFVQQGTLGNLPISGFISTIAHGFVLAGTPGSVTVTGFAGTFQSGADLDQDGFQFIEDDGTEITATDIAAEDTNITRGQEVNTRLRVQIDTTADDPAAATRTLQYKEVGDPAAEWRDVPLT